MLECFFPIPQTHPKRNLHFLSLNTSLVILREKQVLQYISSSSSFRRFHWFQFRSPSWHKIINRKAEQMPRRNCWTSDIWAVERISKAAHSVWLLFIWKPPTSSSDALKPSMAWIIHKCRAPLGRRKAMKYLAVWLLLDTVDSGGPLSKCINQTIQPWFNQWWAQSCPQLCFSYGPAGFKWKNQFKIEIKNNQ